MSVQDQRLPDDLEAQIKEIVDERVDEATADLREENDQLRDQVDQLQEERDDLQERVDDLEQEKDVLESRCDALADGLDRLEERMENGDLADDVEQGADPDVPRETPLEDVVSLPDDVADSELNQNVERARWFASEIKSAGRKTPMGHQLRAGEIGRLLDVALDVDPHPETVARIISILDEMGQDETHRRKKDGEKRIIIEEELADRLEAHSAMSRET